MKPKSKFKLPALTKPLTRTPKPKGFATMRPSEIKRIAALGGKTISRNREYMRSIGSLGGKNSHRNTNGKAQ